MPNPPSRPGQWLDDLESIRDLLGDDAEPGELSPGAGPFDLDSIPVLSEVVDPIPDTTEADTPMAPPPAASRSRQLEAEIRAAANLILQDVIDDFVPQIEAEVKKRLERLLSRRHPDLF